MLPLELWHDIIDCCSPLSLFFLEKTCLAFRDYLTISFKAQKKRHAVPEATSYEELAYFLSLRREEQVKYCVRRDWPKTYSLLPPTIRRATMLFAEGIQRDLLFIPESYAIFYPNNRIVRQRIRFPQKVKFNAKESAKFFLAMTKEMFIDHYHAIDEKDYYKIPLALQREQILANDPERMKDKALGYWLLTGEDLTPQFDKSSVLLYREFLACEGIGECPIEGEGDDLLPEIYYHANASLSYFDVESSSATLKIAKSFSSVGFSHKMNSSLS